MKATSATAFRTFFLIALPLAFVMAIQAWGMYAVWEAIWTVVKWIGLFLLVALLSIILWVGVLHDKIFSMDSGANDWEPAGPPASPPKENE